MYAFWMYFRSMKLYGACSNKGVSHEILLVRYFDMHYSFCYYLCKIIFEVV